MADYRPMPRRRSRRSTFALLLIALVVTVSAGAYLVVLHFA